MTNYSSSTKQWVFRATSNQKEIESLQKGRTLAVAYRGTTVPSWDRHGPQVSDSSATDTLRALRYLSLRKSYSPLSQFSSFALNYHTAHSFGDVVYAMRLKPSSPVLGIQDCSLENWANWEIQYQVMNNTPLTKLRRRRDNGPGWEYYHNGRWQVSKCQTMFAASDCDGYGDTL
jgi:hypothetical protein